MIHKPWGSDIRKFFIENILKDFTAPILIFLFFNFSHLESFLSDLLLTKGLSRSIAYLIAEEFVIPQSFTASFIES